MAPADDLDATVPSRDDAVVSQEPSSVLSVGGGYPLLRLLGPREFGEVWRAEAPGGVEVAVKIVRRAVEGKRAQRELDALQLMKRLRHQNLLVLQAFFPLADRLIIVLELADGSLSDRRQQCRAA